MIIQKKDQLRMKDFDKTKNTLVISLILAGMYFKQNRFTNTQSVI